MNTWRETLLLGGAVHSALFAVFHLFFWRLFAWRSQLQRLSPVNRGIMQVLNVCLTYLLAGMSVLVVLNAAEILSTQLGTHLLVFLSSFWALRLVAQFIWFQNTHGVAWVFCALFLIGTVLYAAVAWGA